MKRIQKLTVLLVLVLFLPLNLGAQNEVFNGSKAPNTDLPQIQSSALPSMYDIRTTTETDPTSPGGNPSRMPITDSLAVLLLSSGLYVVIILLRRKEKIARN